MKFPNYLSAFGLLTVLVLPAFAQESDTAAAEPSATTPPSAASATRPSNLEPHMETLASETNQVSYAIGVNTARNLLHNYPNVDLEFFVLALRDVFAGERPKMSEDMINASIAKYSEEAGRLARERVTRVADKNLENANRFLEVNGKKEGVVTTPSGLQYRIISTGAGPKPGPDSSVRFNCTTKLMNGAVVDSTLIPGGQPLKMALETAMPAWKEAVSQMNVGSKWEIYAHPSLAYGANGAKNVGPNELLIFSIELMGVE